MARLRSGFNLVEIMITLTLIALLTTTLINFVNDFDDKTKVTKARNDLTRLAQQAVLAESKAGTQLSSSSASGSELTTLLLDWIVALPDYDPWGNRFMVSPSGAVTRTTTQGMAYILDPSFGRMICAGPDGVVNTQLGREPSDNDNDIVVEFRQQPWVAYSYTPSVGGNEGEIWVARTDGTQKARVLPNSNPGGGGGKGAMNVTFSPDGARWCGVETSGGAPTGKLICGQNSPQNPVVQEVDDPLGGETATNVAAHSYPFFTPDGNHVMWINANDKSLRICNLVVLSTSQIATVLVMPAGSMPDEEAPDYSDSEGRIVHVSKERSYYFRIRQSDPTKSIGIAVSADGKIAASWYGGGQDGIYLALPSGKNRRRLRASISPGQMWLPLFWEDTQNLIYYAQTAGKIQIRRVGQDGRFDLPLFNHVAANLGPSTPYTPSISRDGTQMAFFYAPTIMRIVRTDGAGWLKNVATNSETAITNPVLFQEQIWSTDMSRLFVAHEYGGGSGIQEVIFDMDQPAANVTGGNPGLNSTFHATPGRMALSPSGLLFASIQAPGLPDGAPATPPGVRIFPLLGPAGASMTISTTAPNPGNTVNIAWIRD